jgi:hypothetical protein
MFLRVTFLFGIVWKSQKHVETSCQVLSDMFDDVKNKSDKRDDLINQHTDQADIRSNSLCMSLIESTAVSIAFNLPSIDDTSCNSIFKITGVLVLNIWTLGPR